MTGRPASTHRSARFVALVFTLVSLVVPVTGAHATAEELCAAPIAATQAIDAKINAQKARIAAAQAKIDVHNAKPRVFSPRQTAAAAAFNAEAHQLRTEAAQLNAEAQELNAEHAIAWSQFDECLLTERMVKGNSGSAALRARPTPEKIEQIDEATKGLDANRQPSSQADRRGYRLAEDERQAYAVFRKGNPGRLGDVELQGRPRPKVGDPDAAYPASSGRTIQQAADGGPAVSPDHIVPLTEVMDRPGFRCLSSENKYLVVNAPLNLQWLSFRANTAKASRSMAFVSGLDDAFWAEQIQLEANVLSQLDLLIQHLGCQG